MTTTQKLNESSRLLAAGRDIQRRYDKRLIETRIVELSKKVHAENDLTSALVIDELNALRDQITAATT